MEPTGENLFESDIPIVEPNTWGLDLGSWALPPLYNQGKTGKWLVWQIMYNSDNDYIITLNGQIGGKLRQTQKQIKINKSNRDMNDQAMLEASSRFTKKSEKGYAIISALIQTPTGFESASHFDVMLAQKYDPKRVERWPLAAEPKIDGIRAYSYVDDNSIDGIAMKSRNHKDFYWLHQIRSQLKIFFTFLPTGSYLDGELYNHTMPFEKISSAVKSQKTENPLNSKLKYYIFDIVESGNLVFEDRYNLLVQSLSRYKSAGHNASNLILVPMTLSFSHEETLQLEEDFLSQGFEGIVVRQLAGTCQTEPKIIPYMEKSTQLKLNIKICSLGIESRTSRSIKLSQYEQKRSYNLMKSTKTISEEATVIDIVSGEGTKEGAAIMVVQDLRGNQFRVSPMGDVETHKQWLINKNKYIGLPYTIKYQKLTEDGVPRFPRGIAFRDYE
jgi:ATP-dependent DNA ligase